MFQARKFFFGLWSFNPYIIISPVRRGWYYNPTIHLYFKFGVFPRKQLPPTTTSCYTINFSNLNFIQRTKLIFKVINFDSFIIIPIVWGVGYYNTTIHLFFKFWCILKTTLLTKINKQPFTHFFEFVNGSYGNVDYRVVKFWFLYNNSIDSPRF